MKKNRIILVCLLASSAAFADPPIVTPAMRAELQAKQMRLNESEQGLKHVDDLYAKVKALRDEGLIKGINPIVKAWQTAADEWMKPLSETLLKLTGTELKNPQTRDNTIAKLNQNLIQLRQLQKEHVTIMATIQRVYDESKTIEKVSEDSIVAVEETTDPVSQTCPMGDLLNSPSSVKGKTINQVCMVQGTLNKPMSCHVRKLNFEACHLRESLGFLQSNFGTHFLAQAESLFRRVDSLVTLKITSLSLENPELAEAFRQVERELRSFRAVELIANDLLLNEKVTDALFAGQIFAAGDRLEELKVLAEAASTQLKSDLTLTPSARETGLRNIASVVSSRQNLYQSHLVEADERSVFKTFYRNELYREHDGLVALCKNPGAVRVDCNLVRTVQGFKSSQLGDLTRDQAKFVESVLIRARKGFFKG